MEIADLISEQSVIANLRAGSKKNALQDLAKRAAQITGLDERAIRAVRQWRFAAAERHGTPVDVLVEVAVEFRLR